MDSLQFKLYNSDCLTEMSKIEKNSIDLILTDPPYNLGNFMRDRQTNINALRSNYFCGAGWDDLTYEEWVHNMDIFFKNANMNLRRKGALIIFMSLIKVETIINIAIKNNFYYKTTGIWHKLNPMPRNMNLHFINSVEGWIYFINEGRTGTYNNDGKAIHDFIETSLTNGKQKKLTNHPTQKPEEIFDFFIELLSNEGDDVMDPFMGSGTCGVVCKKKGRNFYGIEIHNEYYKKACKRIENTKSKKFNIDASFNMNIEEDNLIC